MNSVSANDIPKPTEQKSVEMLFPFAQGWKKIGVVPASAGSYYNGDLVNLKFPATYKILRDATFS